MAESRTREGGMSRQSSGVLYCTAPVAGSMRVGWYCSPAPVEQIASHVDRHATRPPARDDQDAAGHQRLDLGREGCEQLVKSGIVAHLRQHLAQLQRPGECSMDTPDGAAQRRRRIAKRLQGT
eukprot:scaffold1860_cov98-Isochrysis_galbana.AAC.2